MELSVKVADACMEPVAGDVPPRLARARGSVLIHAARRGDATLLADLRQEGSSRVLFPGRRGAALEAVVLNTAGGVTGGDRFWVEGRAGEGAWLGLATQAAERAYRARPGEVGRIAVRLGAAARARVDWLPQETILFDGAAIERRLEVDLAEDAELLAVEPVVFGRTAMRERISAMRLTDMWRVRRNDELIHADALRIAGSAALLARPATFGGAGAMASILLASPGAEARLGAVRRLLDENAGASLVRPDVLVVRMLAPGGLELRHRLIPVLEVLRDAPLPAVWKM